MKRLMAEEREAEMTEKIQAAGHHDVIMTIVTNSDEYPEAAVVATDTVTAGSAGIKTK